MIRVAIVEDNDRDARELERCLRRFEQESGEEIRIQRFNNGLNLVEEYAPVWDLILLDIEMPMLDGMSAAEQIRQKDPVVILIFITNVAQYAIKGYAVNAMDYVLKPIQYYALSMKLTKVRHILEERSDESVILNVNGDARRIPIRTIRYVETADHRLIWHTTDGEITVFGALRDVEGRLGSAFAKCNNCYLVNLRYVNGVRDECVVMGDELLKISRSKKKEFMQALSDYCLYGGR